MKKHNLAEFFKSKGFYALLCVGALAIVVITMASLNQTAEKDKNKNLVDLNESNVSDLAEDEDDSNQDVGTVPNTNNANSSTTANNEKGTSKTEVTQGDPNQAVTDGSLLEFEIDELTPQGSTTNEGVVIDSETALTEKAKDNVVSTEDQPKADLATANDVVIPDDEVVPEKTASKSDEDDAQEVLKPESLNFDTEVGLKWPVTGNVLMNYSVDRVIYFETLAQFKCNPAVIINAEVGTEVLSATKGVITAITNEDETGITITASIGSGYNVVYGQLKDVKVEVGDIIEEGEVLGFISEPSKYFKMEGSNLYFQVLKDEETVNPMLLLR